MKKLEAILILFMITALSIPIVESDEQPFDNEAPIISNPYPENETYFNFNSTFTYVRFRIEDPNGDTMQVCYYTGTPGNWSLEYLHNSLTNTTIQQTRLIEEGNTYYWKVSANDSEYNTTAIYCFTYRTLVPSVETLPATSVTETSATIWGNITDDKIEITPTTRVYDSQPLEFLWDSSDQYIYSFQSITPSEGDYWLTNVSLYIARNGVPGPGEIAITYLNGYQVGLPIEGDLTSVSFNASNLSATFSWVNFTLDNPFFLRHNTSYAIILRCPEGDAGGGSDYIKWALNYSTSYAGGTWGYVYPWDEGDGGYNTSADFTFKLYGYQDNDGLDTIFHVYHDATPTRYTTSSEHLYVGGYSYYLDRLNTSTMQTIDWHDPGGDTSIDSTATDADFIYVGHGAAGTYGSRILKLNKRDLSLVVMSGYIGYGTSASALLCDKNDDTYIYAAIYNETHKLYKSNLTSALNFSSYGGTILTMVEHGNYIYIAGDTTNKIYQLWKTNLTKKAESVSYGGTIYQLAISDNYIYVVGATTNRARKYWNSNLTYVNQSDSYGGAIYAVASDESYIYIGGGTNETVWKLRKDNLSYVTHSESFIGSINTLTVDDTFVYAGGGNFGDDFVVTKYYKNNLSRILVSGYFDDEVTNLLYSSYPNHRETFSYTLTGLAPGSSVLYQAVASNGDYGSGYGNLTAVVTKPSIATNIYHTYGEDYIALSWTKGTGANKTVVCRSKNGFPTNQDVGTIYNGTGNSFNDTGLDAATNYYYTIWSYAECDYGGGLDGSRYGSPVYKLAATSYTWNSTFQVNFPTYLEVGQYIHAVGSIQNHTGTAMSNVWVYTFIENSTGVEVPNSNMRLWVVNGYYQYIFSTSSMIPGVYTIRLNFTHGAIEYYMQKTLYLSWPGEGHVITDIHFSYYDNNTGIGLSPEMFKLYANDTVPLTTSNRLYASTYYNGWTGMTLYYRVDDYFDNQIFPPTGSYVNESVVRVNQIVDVPIDWHVFSVKNMNHSIVKLTIENNTRTVTQYLFPYEEYNWYLLSGVYNLTMNYYNPNNGTFLETKYADVNVTEATYYWIRGYDLRDIIIEIYAVNTSLGDLWINITTGVTLANSSINQISLNFLTNLTATESNITNLIINYWSAVNLTNTVVEYLNNSIWGEINGVNLSINTLNYTMVGWFNLINSTMGNLTVSVLGNVTINDTAITTMLTNISGQITITESNLSYLNTTIEGSFSIINSNINNAMVSIQGVWGSQNTSFGEIENRSLIVFNFYNTNLGLGLPRESLQIYVDGNRLTENVYYTYNASDIINVTIRDYYNTTLFHQNFTIDRAYVFLDLGLTFHSWLFGNNNDNYYIISLLREGATRWWERGIIPGPGGEREFLIPSGNYTLRIYDGSYNMLYNQSGIVVNNSRVYVIEGGNLTEIISGLSVIRGQLLELSSLLQPSIVSVGYNIPYIRSVYDIKLNLNLNGIELICPPQILVATTYNNTETNCTSYPLIPGNTTENGTITAPDYDRIWFQGATSGWVNISLLNGTVLRNSTVPTFYDVYNAPTLQINSSANLSITRETTFHQVKEFYWTKYTDERRYEATVSFENVLNTTLYKVYLYIAFADDGITPDFGGITVYDVFNSMTLRQGEHYDSSAKGIHMGVNSIGAGETRSFQVTYTVGEETLQPSQAIIVLDDFGQMKSHKNKNYYYLRAQWTNTGNNTFIGPVIVQFNFTLPNLISPESIDIWDVSNLRWLNKNQYSYNPYGITISQDTVGQVSPMGARTYEIYYLYTSASYEPTSSVSGFLGTPIFSIPGIGAMLGIHIVVAILLLIGVTAIMSGKSYKDHLWVFSSCMIFIFLSVMAWLQPMV